MNKAIISVFAAFLIHFILGTYYTFGNMNPYITSYLRYFVDKSVSYIDTIWISAFLGLGWGLGSCIGGYVEKWLGLSLTCTFCMGLVSWGVLLTYFTIRISVFATVFTYGVMYGFGIGMGYIVSISAAMSWYPDHPGLAMGFVLSGFGGSPFLFDFLQTKFINTRNANATLVVQNDTYFENVEVLNKVPDSMILFGGIYAAVLILAILMLRKQDRPRTNSIQSIENVVSSSQETVVVNLSPSQVLRTRNFKILWFCMLLNSTASNTLISLYKAFGLSSQNPDISDDTFLALAGSFSAFANLLGRLIWGPLSDHLPYKKLMGVQTMCMTLFLSSFYYIAYLDRATFTLWMIVMHGFIAGNFALFPSITAKTFGSENISANYGIILSGFSLAAIFSAVLSFISKKFDKTAWSAVFLVAALCCLLSFILNLFFNAEEKYTEFEPVARNSSPTEQGNEGTSDNEILSDEFREIPCNENVFDSISMRRQT